MSKFGLDRLTKFDARRLVRPTIAAVIGAVALVSLTAMATPIAQKSKRPPVPATKVLPRHSIAAGKTGPRPTASNTKRADATWPAATSATVDLSKLAGVAANVSTSTADIATINHRAGTSPIQVRDTTAAPATSADASSTVAVSVRARSVGLAAGINGVMFTVAPSSAASPLQVSVDYASFANASGGDFGSRLHLVELPACALTTPQLAACRVQSPLSSTNDGISHVVSATVKTASPSRIALAGTPAVQPATMVLAATADPSGSQGDFTASSLKAAGSWSVGGNTGAFTYSYPIAAPPVAAGNAAPTVALAYNSASVDGMTAAANGQSSWVGEGWDYDPGFIERTYVPCAQEVPALPTDDKTGDECWDGQILTVSLNGQTQSIVQDDTSGDFHLQNDSGARVKRLTGSTNGAQSGEYFQITDTNGVIYTFGVNGGPGYTSADKQTNSVYTEPVYGATSGQPCYNSAGFSKSSCTQAWRWNLDMVQDANGNVAMYYYSPETNYYMPDLGQNSAKPVQYIRGGQLSEIDYGMRLENGSVYGAINGTYAPDRIQFATDQRCFPSGSSQCTFTSANASNWIDTPQDQSCTSSTCTNYSPTFWSTQRLTTITTQFYNSTASKYQSVDSYALSQAFDLTSGDQDLTLTGITRTGYDSTGANPLSDPELTFEGVAYANRVPNYNGQSDLVHWRMYEITEESGEQIFVNFNTPRCTASDLPSDTDTLTQQQAFASTDTLDCYPVYWTPIGGTEQIFDYFYTYTIQSVKVSDPNSLSPTQVTSYIYGTGTATAPAGAAWHYDDNQVVKAADRTYGQFRGYGTVETLTGDPTRVNSFTGVTDQQTETLATFFRGMDGDHLPSGSRTATVHDTLGDPAISDNNAYTGETYETQTFNGVGGAQLSAEVIDPVLVATTATQARTGLPALTAAIVKAADVRDVTYLAAGGTTLKKTASSYDSTGRIVASDASGTGVPEACTTTAYAQNTTTWVKNTPSEVISAAQACPSPVGTALTASAITGDTRTYYDGSTTLGTLPSAGTVTRTDTASVNTAGTLSWITNATQKTYDTSGRVLTAADALGHTTTTSYVPTDGGPATQSTVSNAVCVATPSGAGCAHVVTNTDPGRGYVTKYVDGAGHVTSGQYDSLGRLIAEWTPGFTQGSSDATTTYSYLLRSNGPETVTTNTLVDDGQTSNNLNYKTSISLYDGMGQLLQSQDSGENGTTIVADNFYDSHGWTIATNAQYAVTGAPSTTLVSRAALVRQCPYPDDVRRRRPRDDGHEFQRPDPDRGHPVGLRGRPDHHDRARRQRKLPARRYAADEGRRRPR